MHPALKMTILEQRSSCQYWEAQKGCIFKVTLRGKVYQQPIHSFTFFQAVKIMKFFWFVHKILMWQPFFYTLANCQRKCLCGHEPSLLPYILILNLVHLEMRLEVTIMNDPLKCLLRDPAHLEFRSEARSLNSVIIFAWIPLKK